MYSGTIAEKILSRHAGKQVHPGDIILPEVDMAMATDGSAPMSIDIFHGTGARKLLHPERIVFVEDHYVPCPNEKVAALHEKMEFFAKQYGCLIFKAGEGICHRLLPEKGLIEPGYLVAGADSHSTTYGALASFGTGIGSTDLAGIMYTGKLWLQVPPSIKISFKGQLPPGTFAKDVAIFIAGYLGADGANYQVIEFGGESLSQINIEGRMTLCNMGVETGAKAVLTPFDETTEIWFQKNLNKTPAAKIQPDSTAEYIDHHEIDLSLMSPVLAVPNKVDSVSKVSEWEGKPVNTVVIGTCTNGSLEDLRIASEIIENGGIAKGTSLLVVPPSRTIFLQAMEKGYIQKMVNKGALLTSPGCGPCCGALNGIPHNGETVISTANRNFKGRMGNPAAEIFLSSPATAAASAVKGKITDPGRLLS